MQKVIVFLGVLLASGWTLPRGAIAISDDFIEPDDDGRLTDDVYDRTVRKEPMQRAAGSHPNFSSNECKQANVTVRVWQLRITVPQWESQQAENVSYKVTMTWLEQNQIEKDFEIVLDTLLGYELPVKDSCTIISLVVCRKHVRTSECGCKEWMPPVPGFDRIQISPTNNWSYLLSWNADKLFCLHHYVISSNNHPPTKIFDKNIAPVPLHNIRSCKPNIVRLEMFLVNGRSMCLSTEILIHTDRKSKTNTWACYASVDVTLNVDNCTHKNVPAETQIVPKYAVSKSDATACAMSSVSEVRAYCNVTVDSDGSNMVTSTTVSSHRVHSKSMLVSVRPTPMRDVLKVKATSVRIPSSPPICPGRSGTSFQRTSREVIGPVRDLRAYTDLDRTVLLSWRPPKESHCVKEYVITWATESRTINASMSSYNVTNLEPCMAYEFTVNTIDNTNEKGTPESVTATVRELQQLSEVTELELYEVEPRSLSVKWKPPVNGTYCVQSYRVVAWYTHPNSAENGGNVLVFSNTTNDQHVTFGEVIACMTYTVQVIPISFSNSEGRNELGTLKTKERTILSYHVEPIRALTVKSRSLELSTMLHSENNNNCLMVSVRFNCSMLVEGDPDPASQVVKEFAIPNSNNSFEGIVEPLTPYSVYQCNAQIQNIAGWSDPTPSYEFQTAEDVPESPSVLQLVGSNRSIEIIWKAPAVKNGVVVRYRIHVRMVGPQYPLPKLCAPLEEFNETVDLRDEVNPDEARGWDGVEFQHSLAKLNPYTLYTVQVAAATGAGFGPYTDPEEVVTLPDVSNTTTNFRIERIEDPEIDQPYRSAVQLAWELPCGLHGKLKRFVGLMQGVRERDASTPHELAWNVTIEEDDELLDAYSYVEDRLKPEYNYTVSLSVEVADVSELSPEVQLQFESPAGIPTINTTEEWFNVNVLEAPNPTNTARIVLGNITLTSDIGSIRYMALLISERLCQVDPQPRTGLIVGDTKWPDVSDWYRANNMACVEQYQTTPKFWNPMPRSERATHPVVYVVGQEKCDRGQEYCNGPLKSGTEYALIVRIFSRSGYTDSTLQRFRTDSLIQIGLIVSTIAACLLLAFIGGLVVVCRKQRLLLPAQQTGRAPTEEPADIPLKNFPGQYDELFQSNREKLAKEFQSINYFSDFALQETVSFQSARENERKNRYVNILPFDTNRVPLDSNDDDENGVNDYINASFIEGYKYQREYIATQGPKQETCHDFWRMMLQYEIESIVMLTQPIDHDKNKCCQYYPRFNQVAEFDDIRVKCTQELNLSLYYKRLFLVSKGNLTKPVFHYHFLDWPDHSCPASTADLVKFTKIVRVERKSYAIPLVVHCSAGVGRTGTFIALDIILQRMQQEKKINVFDTVKRLRRQRVKMVQTLDQYSFLYQCCLEYVSKSNRKKPKTSNIEVITRDGKGKPYPDVIVEMDQQVAVGNGGKPLFNIKFPKSVNSGLGTVTSFAPSDIEADK